MKYVREFSDGIYEGENKKWTVVISPVQDGYRVSMYSKARQAWACFDTNDTFDTLKAAKSFATYMMREIGA